MKKLVAVLSLVALLFVGSQATALAESEAYAAAGTAASSPPAVTHTCGYLTCTSYFSRGYTRDVLEPAVEGGIMAFAGVMAVLCAEGGPQAAVACGGATAVIGGFSFAAISQAAANNQCAAFVSDLVGHVGWFRTDNSGYCVD